METVSILTPTFNSEKTLDCWADSVFSQTVLPSEIICMDSQSGDNTVGALKELSKKSPVPLRVYSMQKSPMALVRYELYRLASSRWVFYFDSDDTADSTLLETFLSGVTPGTTLVRTTGHRVLTPKGITVCRKRWAYHTVTAALYDSSSSLWDYLILREALGKIQWKFDHHIGEDLYIVSQLLVNPDTVSHVDALEYLYHSECPNSLMAPIRDTEFTNWEVVFPVFDDLLEWYASALPPDLAEYCRLTLYRLFPGYFNKCQGVQGGWVS